MKNDKILVTGCAGFIGFHVSSRLIDKGFKVFGIDNYSNYYDPKLKENRNKILKKKNNFKFFNLDIRNDKKLKKIIFEIKPKIVIHLAAQAGVRYSLENPRSYIENNIIGFFNIIEFAKLIKVKHFIYASSSSVYGLNDKFPFDESIDTSFPSSLYGATKKTNEVIAFSYSQNFKLPTTGLRFFTVYGPFGRPDMSLFKFVKNIINNKKITLFNHGNHTRDFTYVNDVVECIEKLIYKPPKIVNLKVNFRNKKIPFQIYNICSSKRIKLNSYISLIENYLNKKSIKKFDSLQKGDVKDTFGRNRQIKLKVSKEKFTNISLGIKNFIDWYKRYYEK